DSPWPAVRPASRRARVRRALWLVFTGLFVTLGSACGREGEFGAGRDESGPTIDEARDAVEGADDAGGDAASERAQPREIYYDLTRFDWYRRGEPLVADGRGYLPAGKPEPTGEREFEEEGRYQGVSYYVPKDADSPYDTVYVPVFPGYWQPFVTQAASTGGATDTPSPSR